MLKITIIYDNTSLVEGLTKDWGFACYIEAYGKKILFDTGGNGDILLKNMKLLNIAPPDIDDVVISHPHFDHIGGLSAFLNENTTAVVHVPESFKGIKYKNEVKYYEKPSQIYPGFYLSGELDDLEQALAVKNSSGLTAINEENEYVSRADAVILSSTTVFNQTFVDLINKTKDNCDIYMLGPSSIMHPDIFSYKNIKIVFGSVFNKYDERVLTLIENGEGTRKFLKLGKKVFLIKENN